MNVSYFLPGILLLLLFARQEHLQGHCGFFSWIFFRSIYFIYFIFWSHLFSFNLKWQWSTSIAFTSNNECFDMWVPNLQLLKGIMLECVLLPRFVDVLSYIPCTELNSFSSALSNLSCQNSLVSLLTLFQQVSLNTHWLWEQRMLYVSAGAGSPCTSCQGKTWGQVEKLPHTWGSCTGNQAAGQYCKHPRCKCSCEGVGVNRTLGAWDLTRYKQKWPA